MHVATGRVFGCLPSSLCWSGRCYLEWGLLVPIRPSNWHLPRYSPRRRGTVRPYFFSRAVNLSLKWVFLIADLLTLNSSKTEFLLIGLKNQLAKIHNTLLDTSHSVRNIGFIFSEQITSLSKACYYQIRQLRCIRPYSIRQLPVPLLPLSFTPNLITVILCITNSLSLNNYHYPVTSRSRTLFLLVLSLKLLSPVISLPSYALSTGSKSLNASNKLLSLRLPTKFSQLPKLTTIISVQRPRSIRSSSVVTLAWPPTLSS